MVTLKHKRRCCLAGFATIEMVVAIGLLASALLPLAYSMVREQRLARAYYFRAVAIEIVDGEMEVLRAGEWRAFSPGRQKYRVLADSATNLPAGEFVLTIAETELRLQWLPAKPGQGGPVSRSAPLPEP